MSGKKFSQSGVTTSGDEPDHGLCIVVHHGDVERKPTKQTGGTKKLYGKIVREEELEDDRLIDLGLGRGIDAANPHPWLNKSSFQVIERHLFKRKNIIGTDEGGSVISYEEEVSSVQVQQNSFTTAVTVPKTPVTISLGAELTRTSSETKRAVGTKVVNRTVAIRDDIEQPSCPAKEEEEEEEEKEEEEKEEEEEEVENPSAANVQGQVVTPDDELVHLSFEQQLTGWIMNRLLHQQMLTSGGHSTLKGATIDDCDCTGNSLTDLTNYVLSHKDKKQLRKTIIEHCRAFIDHFRVTHYVSSIELGAAKYTVYTETEYSKQVKMKSGVGVEHIGGVAMTSSKESKETTKRTMMRSIGTIKEDGTVERVSHAEAVLSVKVQPISSLVKLRYLQLALQRALLDYMHSEADIKDGPFLISCRTNDLFLQLDSSQQLGVTTDPEHASMFYIIPTENDAHPNEFFIGCWDTPGGADTPHAVPPMMLYLNAPVNLFGNNKGPLRLTHAISEGQSRLVLHSRVVRESQPVHTGIWLSGRDAYFINCARRDWKIGGYLAVLELGTGYRVGCARSKDDHENGKWMLFRLVPQMQESPKYEQYKALAFLDAEFDKCEGLII